MVLFLKNNKVMGVTVSYLYELSNVYTALQEHLYSQMYNYL